MPEAGGTIGPDNEVHDLIVSVFGGMSEGERNRLRVRVHAAMSVQALMGDGGREQPVLEVLGEGRGGSPIEMCDAHVPLIDSWILAGRPESRA
ncbi:hypothetical protein ACWZEH_26590 [Streptomyces sp. QTS137]